MAEREITWSPGAKQDLKSILNFYIERNGNTKFSTKLLIEIEKVVSSIKKFNESGKATSISNVRVFIHHYYQIFYKLKESEIEILHVWDSRRNPEDLEF